MILPLCASGVKPREHKRDLGMKSPAWHMELEPTPVLVTDRLPRKSDDMLADACCSVRDVLHFSESKSSACCCRTKASRPRRRAELLERCDIGHDVVERLVGDNAAAKLKNPAPMPCLSDSREGTHTAGPYRHNGCQHGKVGAKGDEARLCVGAR
jgi:hypothetical protein